MIYMHYDNETKKVLGWYSDEFHRIIPEPNIEISNDQHIEYLEAFNMDRKDIFVIDDQVVLRDMVDEITWETIKTRRNELLNSTDWTQLPDVDEYKKAQYSKYRQALRDIPETFASPELVVWPQLSDFGIES